LADSTEFTNARNEILSSFSEIFSYIETLLDTIIQRKHNEVKWTGLLVFALTVFFGVIGIILVNLFADNLGTIFFLENAGFNGFYLGIVLCLALSTGLITCFYGKKRYIKEYSPWKNKLKLLKKSIEERTTETPNVTETTIQLMDKSSEWLLDVMKHTNETAATYGIFTFLVVAFISGGTSTGIAVSLLAGIIVWLYFRYEKQKEHSKSVEFIKAWQKKAEKRRNNFLQEIQEGRS